MKLPKFLFDKVKNHNTSLGNNEAFPPEEDYPFDYKMIKKRFEEVYNNLQYLEHPTTNIVGLKKQLSDLIKKVKKIEEPIKPYLIKICENYVNKQLQTPDETIILKCELVNELHPTNMMRLMPEESDARNFDFEDLTDFNNLNKVILKRRLINSLIQGISYKCNEYGEESLNQQIIKLNGKLPLLYKEISIINDYLLFVEEENITDDKPSQGACVEVLIGRNGEKTEINVQGLIFPYLIQETFRGFFELFASHGLPKDNNKANYIIKQSDFLLAEPWDLRFGVGLWNIISENINDIRLLPYFFTSICELPVDDFNEIMKEVFAQTKRGKEFITELTEESAEYVEINSFIDITNSKNADDAVLNDNYISSDELDDFILQEEGEETKNDNADIIQKLLTCTVDDIDFNEEEYNLNGITLPRGMWILHVLVNGTEVPTEYVYFRAEEMPKLNSYQLHLNIDEKIRRNGIAFKLYQAFIKIFGSACSLFKNRASTFYDENGRPIPSDEAINKLWMKLSELPNIKLLNIVNFKKDVIGVKAISK